MVDVNFNLQRVRVKAVQFRIARKQSPWDTKGRSFASGPSAQERDRTVLQSHNLAGGRGWRTRHARGKYLNCYAYPQAAYRRSNHRLISHA